MVLGAVKHLVTFVLPGSQSTSENLYYNGAGQLVYYIAGVAVVYTKAPAHTQHFFLAHDDDIKSLALCPAAVQMADKEYPANTIVATGQVMKYALCTTDCLWHIGCR